MLDRRAEMWSFLEPLVRDEGFQIFDLEVPVKSVGILRLFVWRGLGVLPVDTNGGAEGGAVVRGIGVDDCARVSRRIAPELELRYPESATWTFEVSSPGINRKLKREEHFLDAVGERVRVKGSGFEWLEASPGSKDRPAQGLLIAELLSCREGSLELKDEDSGITVKVPLVSVKEAQVDHKF